MSIFVQMSLAATFDLPPGYIRYSTQFLNFLNSGLAQAQKSAQSTETELQAGFNL